MHFLNFQVESDEKYERLGGSHLGGASLVGIAKLIADVKSRIFRDDILEIWEFLDLDEILQMAEDGDHRNIDILVSDIYGAR